MKALKSPRPPSLAGMLVVCLFLAGMLWSPSVSAEPPEAGKARDAVEDLIALLDEYREQLDELRCRFDVDTHLVEGGCEPAVLRESDHVVPVYLCARQGRYTTGYLVGVVEDLNDEVTPFFERESSGLASVKFSFGGIVSPEMDWGNADLEDVYDIPGMSACEQQSVDHAGARQVFIVVDVEAVRTVGGWAYPSLGPSVAGIGSWGGPEWPGFYMVAAHEIAHSLYGLDHTDDPDIQVADCSEIAWSLMNSHSDCTFQSNLDSLAYYEIACEHRTEIGWPCKPRPEPIIGNVPRSYGAWTSYRSTRYIQSGVQGVAIRQNTPTEQDEARIGMACNYSDEDAEWRFFVWLDWGGDLFHSPNGNSYTMNIRFSEGDLLQLSAREGTGNEYSNISSWTPDARKAAEAMIAHDGELATWHAYDRSGRLFSATFDTAGASVAIQSTLNFCDA